MKDEEIPRVATFVERRRVSPLIANNHSLSSVTGGPVRAYISV